MADLFEEKAKEWDKNDMVTALSSAIGNAILSHAPLHENMQVMDFGAGTGLISSHVAPRVDRITAIDISQAMLEKLAAKPALQGKVDIRCQDIIHEPLEDRFDLIMSAMAMHHVEDTDKLMRRFAEHLRDGGSVALADLDAEDGSFHPEGTEGVFHAGFDRESLRPIMEQTGFIDVEFFTAHTVNREGRDYPIFLVTARLAH